MDDRRISIAIPTYNRNEMLFNSFSKVYESPLINEIVIVDDASDFDCYKEIESICLQNKKIELYRNFENLDCYKNKREAIKHVTNKWVIIFDSDNVLDYDYLNCIFDIKNWEEDTVYCPTFAKPSFDYREFSGLTIDRGNIHKYVNEPMFLTALNTFNCFINKENYLKVFDDSIDPIVNDSIFFMYCWLNSGRKIHFTKNLEYIHTVHSGSHYQKNVSRTSTSLTEEIENKIRYLK